jgi:hypothetical protein
LLLLQATRIHIVETNTLPTLDVEAAVAILEPNSFPKSYPDPTGGRGFNGPITRQLQNQAAVPPPTNKKAEEVIRSAV